MAARLPPGVVETQRTHIGVWLPFGLAFLAQLTAPVPDPDRGLVEFAGTLMSHAGVRLDRRSVVSICVGKVS